MPVAPEADWACFFPSDRINREISLTTMSVSTIGVSGGKVITI